MEYRLFSENAWVYPDDPAAGGGTAELHCARNADTAFQLLTDSVLDGGEPLNVSSDGLPCGVQVYQLLSAHAGRNSGPDILSTDDYDLVKDFVTRKAPFDVYDVTWLSDKLQAGRAAFYVRLDVPADAQPGTYDGTITLAFGSHTLAVPVMLKVYQAEVPALTQARFRMVNWIYYDKLAQQHRVGLWSEDYWRILDKYLLQQIDMRSDVLMLPAGEPVRNADGRVIDFDFTHAALVGNRALAAGMRHVMGGFSVHCKSYSEPELHLLWDPQVDACSIEGFRQLKLYFRRAWECVQQNGWTGYMQCIMDEPNFVTAVSYRAVSGICRQMMPGVIINDPVEGTNLGGAVDIWVVKQAVFEKHLEDFQTLQQMGEEMWLYSCGYPAGRTMNRVIDLPLSAGRLHMWMCCKYNAPGFLHFGYHLHNEEFWGETCYRASRGRQFPPGNAAIVYPGEEGPQYSVRAHLQRMGAQDYELLCQLKDRDAALAEKLIAEACRTFDDYETDAAVIDDIRRRMLEAL